MVQKLTPISSLLDRGAGVADIDAALAAATDVALQFENTGDIVLFVSNSAGGVDVTVEGEADPYGRSADVGPTTIAATKIGFVTFCNPQMFNTGGLINVTLSVIANTKVGIYRLTKQV